MQSLDRNGKGKKAKKKHRPYTLVGTYVNSFAASRHAETRSHNVCFNTLYTLEIRQDILNKNDG